MMSQATPGAFTSVLTCGDERVTVGYSETAMLLSDSVTEKFEIGPLQPTSTGAPVGAKFRMAPLMVGCATAASAVTNRHMSLPLPSGGWQPIISKWPFCRIPPN